MLRKTKVEQAEVSALLHARMAAAAQHPGPVSGKLRPPTVERESVRRDSCRRPRSSLTSTSGASRKDVSTVRMCTASRASSPVKSMPKPHPVHLPPECSRTRAAASGRVPEPHGRVMPVPAFLNASSMRTAASPRSCHVSRGSWLCSKATTITNVSRSIRPGAGYGQFDHCTIRMTVRSNFPERCHDGGRIRVQDYGHRVTFVGFAEAIPPRTVGGNGTPTGRSPRPSSRSPRRCEGVR